MLLDTLHIEIHTKRSSERITEAEEEKLYGLASDLLTDIRIAVQDILRHEPEFKQLYDEGYVTFS